MFRGLSNVLIKEIKELIRDPKILIGMIIAPVIMFPLMGAAMRISMETARESITGMLVVVMDFDEGEYARNLTDFLRMVNVTIVDLDTSSLNDAFQYVQQHENITGLIVIPEGFSSGVASHDANDAKLYVYAPYRGKGLAESASYEVLNALIEMYRRSVAPNPFTVDSWSVVKGEGIHVSPSTLFGLMMSQFIGVPIGIMMLLVLAMQLAATSVASEKEQKTLETLLSMPINRMTILSGKLAGSVIVALVGALAYLVGFSYYTGSFTALIPEASGMDLAALGLAPSLLSYIIMGTSLFVSLISALALAISISVLAEDVRSAQAIVGPLNVIIMLPMIFTMYTDINALPFALRIVLLAIPYTHPMLASRAALTGDYLTALLGIVYVAAFTVVVLYIAARIFGTEKILTAKLRLKKFRLRKSE